jgi:hypothetical protein
MLRCWYLDTVDGKLCPFGGVTLLILQGRLAGLLTQWSTLLSHPSDEIVSCLVSPFLKSIRSIPVMEDCCPAEVRAAAGAFLHMAPILLQLLTSDSLNSGHFGDTHTQR